MGKHVQHPEVDRANGGTEYQQGHALARVIRGRGRRVVAVVGGDEQQVVLAKGGEKLREGTVEREQ